MKMLQINKHTIMNLDQVSLINLNSNYIYLNGDTYKVSDEEIQLIIKNIEVIAPIEKVVIEDDNKQGVKERKSTRKTNKEES